MNPHHHLDASTVIAYSAGALPAAFAAVVSAHLSICSACRQRWLDADRVGGHFLKQQEGAPLSSTARASMLARLSGEEPEGSAEVAVSTTHDPHALPKPLWPYFGETYQALRWRLIGPGVHHIRARDVTDSHLMLLRVAPGRSLPMHSHGGNELTMILQGAYDDSLGHFAPGDVADLDCDVEHQPVTSPGVPCICVAATDAPLRFSGWLARTLQPLFNL
ncbi:ChrR family anti-sigma-E factor [Dyella sp. C11]|uniref:ChrR family anti-sigma-E factor n=1 Tax=Dyella sp. C11 TaxID=2126991 RepID=UPI000D6504FA|nr:ChrR family anti-sigma-E factor [Dyella sp. C11]